MSLFSQELKILPPALDDLGQRVFFGSSLTLRGALTGTDVYVLDATGQRRLTRVATAKNQAVAEFAVSQDGSHLAYAAVVGTGSSLDVVDLGSGTDHAFSFSANPSRPGSPHFAEGTNEVVFNLFGAPSQHTAAYGAPILIVNNDGTGLKRLRRGALAPGAQRVVSKNGLIVFTSSNPFATTALPQPPVNVYVMKLDGSDVRAITHFTAAQDAPGSATIAASATISSAGDVIAFETFNGTRPQAPSQIWTVSTDGSALIALTQPDERCDAPSISADGARVAFVCKGQLYIAKKDGSGRQALTHFRQSVASSPVISADGSRVCFTIGPVSKFAGPIAGPMQQDSYARGAIWSVNTDGTKLAAAYSPRLLTPGGVVDALSFNFLYPPAGGLITAFGANLAGDSLQAAAGAAGSPLPDALNGVALMVNGQAVPILAVTPWQVNAQLPPDLPDGPTTFEIRFEDGTKSNAIRQEVRAISPNVLTLSATDSPDCQDAVVHADGSVADARSPASAGEQVEIFASGLGPTRPQVQVGMAAPASPLATLRSPITVLLGGIPAQVGFAGLAPGLIGVYQINAAMPAGLAAGRRQVTFSVNGGTLVTGPCFFSVK